MPKLTKGDVTVETELPTEINQLKASGFRETGKAASAPQEPENAEQAPEGGKPSEDAAAAKGKPATGKPSK